MVRMDEWNVKHRQNIMKEKQKREASGFLPKCILLFDFFLPGICNSFPGNPCCCWNHVSWWGTLCEICHFVPCKVVFEEASEGRADMLFASVYLLSLEVSCLHRLYVFTCWEEFTIRQGVYRLNTIISVWELIFGLRVHLRRQNAKPNVMAIRFFPCRFLYGCTIFQCLPCLVSYLLVLLLSHSLLIIFQCDGPFKTCSH